MEILIEIKEKKVKIKLLDGKKEVDSLEIVEEHSLSKKLLPVIDELLKRNKLEVKEVEKVRVLSDQDDAFTTTRIARTVAETWNFTCG
ncbi:MAG: hypothetical protein WC022_00795 [Parcubacteria group bacterium]